MIPLSYPARQSARRLARAVQEALFALAVFMLATAALSAGIPALAVGLFGLSLVLAFRSRRWSQLARQSSIGARSERRVRAQLRALEREGWRIRHSLPRSGGGDIDHVAIAPGPVQLVFAIETKTRSYQPSDLARIAAIARSCRQSAVPILCLAGTHRVERWEGGVYVVSAERLVALLSRRAGTTAKPRFLHPQTFLSQR